MASDIPNTDDLGGGAYQLPDAGDVGVPVFEILEEFMTRMSTHTHVGEDSKNIGININKGLQEFSAPADFVWVDIDQNGLVGNGTFRATLPTEVGTTYDSHIRKYFFSLAGGDYIEFYPTVRRIDNDTYNLYMGKELAEVIDIRVVTI